MPTERLRRKVTVDDLVRHSGVSRSSVFRYFQGKPLRAPLREALETAIAHLDGNPARPAVIEEVLVSLSPGATGFPGFAQVVEGLMERMAEGGGRVRLISGIGDLPPSFVPQVGVVILGKAIAEEEAEAARLESLGLPFVVINRWFDHCPWSAVGIDNRRAAREAVGLLLDQGHRRIGLWTEGETVNRNVADKVAGYRDAFATWGLEVPQAFLLDSSGGSFSERQPALWSGEERPTAWFALDDSFALQVIAGARKAGLRVPQDLAVVGFNDIEAAQFTSPSLTTIHVPFRRFGTDAVEVLEALIRDPGRQAIQWILKHQLIERESTGFPQKQGESL